MKIWRASDGMELRNQRLFRSKVGDLRFARSGRSLVVCEAFTSELKVVDSDGKVTQSFRADDRRLLARVVAISDDATHVALGTYSISKQQLPQPAGRAIVWRVSDGKRIAERALDPTQILGIAFDRSGKELLVGAGQVTGIPLK